MLEQIKLARARSRMGRQPITQQPPTPVHVFFGDDSIRKATRPGMSRVVAFGGLLLPIGALRTVQASVAAIRKEFGFPRSEEIKWSPRKDSWIYQNLQGDRRTACYRQVLSATREAGGTAFVVCYDVRDGTDPAAVLRRCIDWCFERVTMCLKDRNSLGFMICDRPGGGKKEEEGLLEDVLGTIEQGTDFVPPSQVPLNILTTPSHLVVELQIADLITGITTAMVAGESRYAVELFEEIKPMFHRNAYDTVGGAGLKLFPNALLNLHYWVGGEDTFCRVGANAG